MFRQCLTFIVHFTHNRFLGSCVTELTRQNNFYIMSCILSSAVSADPSKVLY